MENSPFVQFADLLMLAIVPYLLASQGTMLAGQTGLFIVSQEGIMLVGASVGFLGAWLSGSLLVGLLAAAVVGALFGLALAYFTTTLKLDQFVIGLALFFLGLGLSNLLFKLAVGVTLQPPIIPTLQDVPIPLLSKIPVLGPIVFDQNWLVYFSLILSFFLMYFLYATSWGLNLRAVGENPKAADSLGVSVVRARYVTSVLAGVLMALAGAYLPMVYTGSFTDGIVNGRGWIAIALTFFGGWSPHMILVGSIFFAGVEILALRSQVLGVGLPHQLLRMIPFLATILVMFLTYRRVRQPAFLGLNYDRESRTSS